MPLKLRDVVSEGANPKVAAFEAIQELRGQREAIGFLDWNMRTPEPKAGTLNFNAFPFQVEMYHTIGSQVREWVCRKATQIGVSTMTIRWALYEADRNGRTVLYVFPTSDDVFDFADSRISPLFDISEYLDSRRGDPFNKGLKRVGRGLVYFRGSESKRKLDSVDGDCLALDEYDTLNQANIPDAERRLSGPLSAGLVRRVGVPSMPEHGIAAKYDESDMRKWLVRCENTQCKSFRGLMREAGDKPLLVPNDLGGWQEIDFWRNVKWEEQLGGKKIVNARIVCEHCGEPLDVSKGVWAAQQPESDIPGFHVSRLIAPLTRLEDVVKASKKTTPYEVEVFYNKDLGMPFISKEARLGPEEIKAAQREFALQSGYDGQNAVTMGVDVASERALNVRISEHLDDETKRALWIGEVEDDHEGLAFDKLSLLMRRYHVNMTVIDALPESRLARQLATRHPGRVYLCRYTESPQVLTVDEELGEVKVRRTEAIDATNEMIRRQKNLLPAMLPDGYISHLTANVRRVERDENDKVKVYYEATRPNDYSMAEVYDLVATEMWWIRQEVETATREEERPLDEMVEFNRSQVNELGNMDISLGPGGGDSPFGSDSMYGGF